MEFDLETGKSYFLEAFKWYRISGPAPGVKISYYPYVNTNHTIRLKNETVVVRVSDTFKKAPAPVHRALAFILVGKLLGRSAPEEFTAEYRRFVRSDDYFQIALRNKKRRGKKMLTSPAGERFDLNEIFRKLNSHYFQNRLDQPDLSWSQRPTFRRLGHHDAAHEAIIISRSLDRRGVPEYVVEYVLYHEMLHIKHPVTFKNGRRYIHTRAFRDDEARFELYDEAENWIEKNAARLKKQARLC